MDQTTVEALRVLVADMRAIAERVGNMPREVPGLVKDLNWSSIRERISEAAHLIETVPDAIERHKAIR